MSTIRVWIADDDRGVRVVLGAALRDAGLEVREFADAKGVLDALTDDAPDVLFSDVRMPGKSGLELLAQLATLQPSLPVIVMSAFTDVSTTSAAYRHGAFDYLPKPFDLDVALDMVMRAMAQHGAEPPRASNERLAAIDLIGNSTRMRELFRAMGRMASSDMTVLITGETGTGAAS